MKTFNHSRCYMIYYISDIPGDIHHTMLDTFFATRKRVRQLKAEGFTILQISRFTYEEVSL